MRVIITLSLNADDYKLIQRARETAAREGRHLNLSRILRDPIRNTLHQYVHNHGAGNPSSTITDFVENPDFSVCPMVFSEKKVISEYMEKIRPNSTAWVDVGEKLSQWVTEWNKRNG